MPALNIEFTDEELARLRERASIQGMSLKIFAHDTVVRATTQDSDDDAIMAAYGRIKGISAELLRRLAQ